MMIIAPVKTEKAIGKIEYENALTFKVKPDSNKDGIKKEVEAMFNVKVLSVRTFLTAKGKKQAIVRLAKEFKADDIAAKLKMIA